MKIVERFPAYGVHYYEVKDKEGFPWWIGLSYKGIGQYDYIDKKTPRKLFPWEKLENVYFKQRKFSFEVHKRRRIQTTRRPLGPGKLIVYTWFASAASLAKTIWLMAVAQHQFYLDCSHGRGPINLLRNYEEIAAELSGSVTCSTLSLTTSKSSPSLSVFKHEGEYILRPIDENSN
ncbi:FERM domain-containing protein 4A-like [Tachypleus tridentatus]|uniref:FERM domain-containing protein 4A-like n=1 Tax=Tachypleus tridentatus TaxID=6853 RepID=UPI003FD578F2